VKELLAPNFLQHYDILILVETFLKENLNLRGFYSRHILATQAARGRPKRGISVYFNAKLGKLINYHRLENFLILNFENITIVGSYLHPDMKPDTVANEMLSTVKFIKIFKALFMQEISTAGQICQMKRLSLIVC